MSRPVYRPRGRHSSPDAGVVVGADENSELWESAPEVATMRATVTPCATTLAFIIRCDITCGACGREGEGQSLGFC